MRDDLSLPERACCRTPMQWSTEPNGGFSKSNKPVVPVISSGPYGFQHVNAAEQRRDSDSMLNRFVAMHRFGRYWRHSGHAVKPCCPSE